MPDLEDFTITCTAISSPFGGLSDIGSPGVDGPPVMPEDPYAYVVAAIQALPSPDYVPGPGEPEQAPPLPEFVPEPLCLKFMPPEDNDPEEDNDEDPEEDPADYPTNRDDDEEEENGPSGDEADDDDEEDEDDDEEEEEHLAPADSTAVAFSAVNHVTSIEETEPFETDESAAIPPPHPAYRVTARMSIRDEPPIPFWSEAEIARLLDIPSPLPSPLSS
ncbi:hypothetical protein Tco_0693689 [Tanacetum coccineum]